MKFLRERFSLRISRASNSLVTQLEAWVTLLVQHIDGYYLRCQQIYRKRIVFFETCHPACDIGHCPHAPGVNNPTMFGGRLTHSTLGWIDEVCAWLLPAEKVAEHRRTGERGEREAYFYLRRRGYIMVAQNFRSPRRHGEIDLVGWDGKTLCFVEVKTRRSRDVKPAEAAVDRKKRQQVIAVAREFLRYLPAECPWRFDLVTVNYEGEKRTPRFELFTDVLPL